MFLDGFRPLYFGNMENIFISEKNMNVLAIGINLYAFGGGMAPPMFWPTKTSKFCLLLRYKAEFFFLLFPYFQTKPQKIRGKQNEGKVSFQGVTLHRAPPILDEGTPNHFEKLTPWFSQLRG